MEKQSKTLVMIMGGLLKEMFRVLKKRNAEQAEANLTIEQFRLLYLISKEEEEVNQKQIADLMGKDESAILRMIDCLESRDLVRRVVDQNDRRKNRLMVSKKGDRSIEQWLNVERELNKELLEGLEQSDIDTFFRVIDYMRNKAKDL
jgi:MarR family transcriptional regulator for hemolysin